MIKALLLLLPLSLFALTPAEWDTEIALLNDSGDAGSTDIRGVMNACGYVDSNHLKFIETIKAADDTVKLDCMKAAKAAWDQSKQLQAGIDTAYQAQKCGREVLALLLVRNSLKSPTPGQIKVLVQQFGEIQSLLEAGSLDTARAEIVAADLTGTIANEADRTALIAKLDACNP